MTDHAPKLLKEIELFSELNDEELEEVGSLAQIRKIETPAFKDLAKIFAARM